MTDSVQTMTHVSPYATTERPEIRSLIPEHARTFLDVGCNDGGFGAALAKEDPRRSVWGVEPDPAQVQLARMNLEGAYQGMYDEYLSQSEQSFDCITFNHVLEHMTDPWTALQQTHPRLNAGGSIIAVLPNIRYIDPVLRLVVHGRWDYRESGILDRTHLRFFTRASIEPLFTESGYKVLAIQPVNGIASVRYPRLSRVITGVLRDFGFGGFAVHAQSVA